MKANITSAVKQILPVYSADAGQDVDTLMVVVGVDFVNDDGSPYSHQDYAKLPGDLDAMDDPKQYFQDQADVMQNDIDQAAIDAPQVVAQAQADDVISKLTS